MVMRGWFRAVSAGGTGLVRDDKPANSILPGIIWQVALFFLALGILLAAQIDMTRRQSGRWGLDDAYARLFNPDSIETVAGKVVVLDSFVPQKGMARGLVIHVDTESGELIPVQVGPLWYLKENNVKILPEDRVSVRGSRIYFEGTSVLMAMEVTIQGKGMLRLRNRKGRPVWSTLVPGKNTNGRRVSAVSYL